MVPAVQMAPPLHEVAVDLEKPQSLPRKKNNSEGEAHQTRPMGDCRAQWLRNTDVREKWKARWETDLNGKPWLSGRANRCTLHPDACV